MVLSIFEQINCAPLIHSESLSELVETIVVKLHPITKVRGWSWIHLTPRKMWTLTQHVLMLSQNHWTPYQWMLCPLYWVRSSLKQGWTKLIPHLQKAVRKSGLKMSTQANTLHPCKDPPETCHARDPLHWDHSFLHVYEKNSPRMQMYAYGCVWKEFSYSES